MITMIAIFTAFISVELPAPGFPGFPIGLTAAIVSQKLEPSIA
jgi:hypothetical protein